MRTRQDFVLFGAIIILFNACSNGSRAHGLEMSKTEKEEEKYRPGFHFTPENNWMNDPNGMFYLNGTFHLYFQHHPESNVWGPMHWGHATSEDLLNWQEHPIALYPDDLGTIFSGSAVVDFQNTSGLGSLENPPIVAIYTNHDAKAAEGGSERFQTQGIAYSLDEGHSWIKYKNNPVIDNPGIRDFRDPKVFWLDGQKNGF
jgi:levanase/fructan beta-fructosidase